MKNMIFFIFIMTSCIAEYPVELKKAIQEKECILVGEMHTETVTREILEASLPQLKMKGFVICIEIVEGASRDLIRDCDHFWGNDPKSSGSLSHLIKKAQDEKVEVIYIDSDGSIDQRDKTMSRRICTLMKEGKKVIALMGAAHVNKKKATTVACRIKRAEYKPVVLFFKGKECNYDVIPHKNGGIEIWNEVVVWGAKPPIQRKKLIELHVDHYVEVQ